MIKRVSLVLTALIIMIALVPVVGGTAMAAPNLALAEPQSVPAHQPAHDCPGCPGGYGQCVSSLCRGTLASGEVSLSAPSSWKKTRPNSFSAVLVGCVTAFDPPPPKPES